MAEDETKEGPRSLTVFLNQVAEGDLEAEGSALLHRLVGAIQLQARAQGKATGEFTMKLKLKGEGAAMAVIYELNIKEPAPRRPGSVFFVTRGGNLSVEKQDQLRLPLHEVPRQEPVEVELPEHDALEGGRPWKN